MTAYITARNVRRSVKYSAPGKYCYLANPKAACSTIKFALWKKEYEEGRVDHLPTTEQVHGDGFWSSAYSPDVARSDVFTFSIVRNPYRRVLSCYLDKIVRPNVIRSQFCAIHGIDEREEIGFEQFLTTLVGSSSTEDDPHWASQSKNLLVGALPINFVGSLEFMGEDFAVIGERVGLPQELTTRNRHATNAGDKVPDYLTPKAVELIRQLYADDFHNFGYDTDPANSLPSKRQMSFGVQDRAAALFVRGMASQEQDLDDAIAALQELRRLDDRPALYPVLVRCLVRQGAVEEASRVAEEGRQRFPTSHETLNACAIPLLHQKDITGAAKLFAQITDLAPHMGIYWVKLSSLLMKLQRFEDAAKLPAKARGMDGSMSKVCARAGEAILKLQRPEEAMRHFERSLKLDPDNERAQAGRERAAKRLAARAEANRKRAGEATPRLRRRQP